MTGGGVFWSGLTERDKTVLSARNAGRRFDMSVIYKVARRCGDDFPQVIVCYPFLGQTPFPTTFWLTCPYLDRKCGALESERQIFWLEKIFEAEKENVTAWHEEYINIRKSLLDLHTPEALMKKSPELMKPILENGAGGINYRENPAAAKCLHLQTAAWLGMGRHPAASWLEEKFCDLECSDAQCKKFMK